MLRTECERRGMQPMEDSMGTYVLWRIRACAFDSLHLRRPMVKDALMMHHSRSAIVCTRVLLRLCLAKYSMDLHVCHQLLDWPCILFLIEDFDLVSNEYDRVGEGDECKETQRGEKKPSRANENVLEVSEQIDTDICR